MKKTNKTFRQITLSITGSLLFTLASHSMVAATAIGIDIDLFGILDDDSETVDVNETSFPDVFIQSPITPENNGEPEPTQSADDTDKAQEEAAIIDVVEVNEAFYRVRYDAEEGRFVRRQTQEAGPGDIIEVVVSATNKSNVEVRDIQMVHSLPRGPVAMLEDSITIDAESGSYRVSQTGVTFFPPEAEVPAANIRFIEWQLISIGVGETKTLSYRIQIN